MKGNNFGIDIEEHSDIEEQLREKIRSLDIHSLKEFIVQVNRIIFIEVPNI